MSEPLCKIARETGGDVPLSCLFGCPHNCAARDELDEKAGSVLRGKRCQRCGSTDVRWRQQGGKWVLFSLTPGVLHACTIDTDGFGPVPE